MFNLTNDCEFNELLEKMNKSLNNDYEKTYVKDRTDIKLDYDRRYDFYTLKDIYNIVKLRRMEELGIIEKSIASKLSFIYLKYIHLKKDKDDIEFLNQLKEILDYFGLDEDLDLNVLINNNISNNNYNIAILNEIVDDYGSFKKRVKKNVK